MKKCPRIVGKWGFGAVSGLQNYCFSRMGTIILFFCESWHLSRVSFKSTVICHCNGYFDRRCKGWFIDEVVEAYDLALCVCLCPFTVKASPD